MSFILDALRKSESERQRQAVPGITYGPAGRQQTRSFPWGAVIAVLLVVNAAVVGYVWLTNDSNDDGEPVVRSNDAPAAVVTDPAVREPEAQSRAEPPARTETSEEPAQLRQAERTASTAAAVSEPVANEPELVEPEPVRQEPVAQPSDESLPTLARLILDGVFELPPMHVDVHFYDPSGNGFVSVNGDILRSGSVMKEGPVVESVIQDGAIMRYRGTRFVLPRN